MYYTIAISNNTFTITQEERKQQSHDFAKDTLQKLQQILRQELSYAQDGSAFSRLTKETLTSKIKELSAQISERYLQKYRALPWFIQWLESLLPFQTTLQKVSELQAWIDHFTPPRTALFPIPIEVTGLVLDHLSVRELTEIRLVNRQAAKQASLAIHRRAFLFDYQKGSCHKSHFKRLFEAISYAEKNRLVPPTLIAYRETHSFFLFWKFQAKKVDLERTLVNLKYAQSNEIIAFTSDENALNLPHSEQLYHLLLRSTKVAGIAPSLIEVKDRSLHRAASRGLPNQVALLLRHGAIASRVFQGMPALVKASTGGKKEVVELLLAHGEDPNSAAENGSPALHFAAQGGHIQTMNVLLANGATINARGWHGRSALVFAATEGKNEAVQALLIQGIDPQIAANNGSQALHFAAQKGRTETVGILLDHAVAINSLGANSRTALLFAAEAGENSVVELLLQRGADPTITDLHGSLPLHFAAQKGHIDCVKSLLAYTPDINIPGAGGLTALEFAQEASQELVVELLLTAGAH